MTKSESELMAEALSRPPTALIDDSDRPPNDPKYRPKNKGWMPDLNPTQLTIFNDTSPVVVAYGPKGTGKTVGVAGHKVVRHCYDYRNALVEIIAFRSGVLGEGIGHDLDTLVLDAWENGNIGAPFINEGGILIPNPQAGQRIDQGIGLERTPWKLDPVSKDKHLWIRNRYGGWGKILMISIPHAAFLEARIKGPAPSMVVLEEGDNAESKEYYTKPALQLGRRTAFKGPQQFLATANPAGPEHWMHKWLWEEEIDEVNGVPDWDDREKPGIKRNPNVHVYFVPLEENKHRLTADYLKHITDILKNDPVQRARLIDGKWMAAPSGEALFKEWFNRGRHVKGDSEKSLGLVPLKGHPIIVGYDPGPVNMAVTFAQCIETVAGPLWLEFDDLFFYRKRVDYRNITGLILQKMAYWQRRIDYPFHFIHISDDSALTQSNTRGSTYARDLLDYSKERIGLNPDQYGKLEPIKLRGCPKPPDSIRDRALKTVDLLAADPPLLLISATCKHIIRMFEGLEHEPGDVLQPTDPSKHKHMFDALSYPVYLRRYVAIRGFSEQPESGSVSVTRL